MNPQGKVYSAEKNQQLESHRQDHYVEWCFEQDGSRE